MNRNIKAILTSSILAIGLLAGSAPLLLPRLLSNQRRNHDRYGGWYDCWDLCFR